MFGNIYSLAIGDDKVAATANIGSAAIALAGLQNVLLADIAVQV